MNILEELEYLLGKFNKRRDKAEQMSNHVAFSDELKMIYVRERDTWGIAIYDLERVYREFKESMKDV
jgi:hypothetical protein